MDAEESGALITLQVPLFSFLVSDSGISSFTLSLPHFIYSTYLHWSLPYASLSVWS